MTMGTDKEAADDLRSKIVAEIMKLVRPDSVVVLERPTIAELEAILNAEEEPDIHLNPDGSISARPKQTVTVGDVADAVLRIIGASEIAALRSRVAQRDAALQNIAEFAAKLSTDDAPTADTLRLCLSDEIARWALDALAGRISTSDSPFPQAPRSTPTGSDT